MFLSNNTNEQYLTFANSSYNNSFDRSFINVTLTELQRSLAIAISNTSGGDGTPIIFDAKYGAVQDIATNPNLGDTIIVKEIPDTILPQATSASVDYDSGILTIFFSETIDSTPKTLVDVSFNSSS